MKYPLLKKYGISCESRVGDIEFALSKAEGIHTNTFYVKRQVWDGDFEVFGTFKSSIEYLLVLTAILAIAVLVVVAANWIMEPPIPPFSPAVCPPIPEQIDAYETGKQIEGYIICDSDSCFEVLGKQEFKDVEI